MEIRQESPASTTRSADSEDIITNKREITTTALVDDGDILVIGGLVDNNDAR